MQKQHSRIMTTMAMIQGLRLWDPVGAGAGGVGAPVVSGVGKVSIREKKTIVF